RRVNNTLLKGLRNDIEVFRCRGLIDETPVYQEHLAKVNAIRHSFPDLLLEGKFVHTDGFTCSNPAVTARGFAAGNRLAIVATSLSEGRVTGRFRVPGYRLTDSRTIGNATVRGNTVSLGLNDLAVLVFEKR
ncbi:MAG: hypothetical protein IKH49_05250, partial [Bacteroidales bacterium]|nr:hypothetical protein [Bacteroidales bacterium]